MPSRPLILWRFVDGKPGHEKQTSGLARALANLTPVAVHDIACGKRWRNFLGWLRGTFPPGITLPQPDLILAAGHGCHFAGLAARRALGGKLVVLMRPSLPADWFDLCLIPEHDQPAVSERIVTTRGALNAVQPGGAHHADAGLILVGGPSEQFAWDDAAVISQVRQLAEGHPDMHWRLSTSRRTPASFTLRMGLARPANLSVLSHTETPAGWVESALSEAGQAWVTEDSVSMLYEALTAGGHVGLLRLSRKADGRVGRGIDKLLADGWVTAMEGWRAGVCPSPPRSTFNEAERCARLILEKWFPRAA
jgi:mitochondrial fission protein ELM1